MYDNWIKYFELPYSIDTLLNQDEISWLTDSMFKEYNKKRMKKGGTIHFLFNRGKYDNFIFDRISLPEKIIDAYSEGNFYITSSPYKLHCDVTDRVEILDEWIPWKTILIPLYYSNNLNDYCMFLFSQRYLGLGNNFDKSNKIKTDSWGTISKYDNSLFVNKEGISNFNNNIDYNFWLDNLSYQDYESFKDLEYEYTLKYIPGSINLFDAAQLHASKNFSSGYKIGLNLTVFIKT